MSRVHSFNPLHVIEVSEFLLPKSLYAALTYRVNTEMERSLLPKVIPS